MAFGEKLRIIRKLNKLSQEQMAELLFTTQGNYSQYENDNRLPSLDLLKRLVEHFNLDANWLLDGRSEQIVNLNQNSSDKYYQTSTSLEELSKKLDILLKIITEK